MKVKQDVWQIVSIFLTVALLAGLGFGYWQYKIFDTRIKTLTESNSSLDKELASVQKDRSDLMELSTYQQSIIDRFQGQIDSLGSTVGTLSKLAQTDEELLRKYSKVFFLSENYVPGKLTQIDSKFVLANGGGNYLIHTDVWPHLKSLLESAHSSSISLLVASAYRSFGTQGAIKSGYTFTYGAGTANQFSADQGYSEHQLGTAVDFTTASLGASFSGFKSDPAYQWLQDNAYKYGFTLSYPEKNSYYMFEPWHWRYVGVDLATRLHDEDKHFYDLDQRDIDTYLVKLFD